MTMLEHQANLCMFLLCMHVSVFDLFDRGSGKMPASLVEGALMDSEASVLATFDFLANENVVDDDDENLRYALSVCL